MGLYFENYSTESNSEYPSKRFKRLQIYKRLGSYQCHYFSGNYRQRFEPSGVSMSCSLCSKYEAQVHSVFLEYL